MRARLLRLGVVSAILFWLLSTVGYAQARYAGTGPGAVVTVGGTVSGFESSYGDRLLGGGSVYVDLNPYWRYGLEAEGRLLRLHQVADTHESTYLAGPRISFGKRRFDPYVKVLAGLGRFNFPYDYAYGNYFVIAPGVGLDYRLSRRVKVRVVDVEYQDWPQFTFGALHPYGVSAGISVAVVRSGTKRGIRFDLPVAFCCHSRRESAVGLAAISADRFLAVAG